jgi:hypothetical protein
VFIGLPGAPMLYNEDSLGNADVSRDDCWELLALVSKKSNGRSTASTTVADNFDLSRQRTSQALTIIRRATLPRKKEHKRLLNKVSRDDDVMREVTGVVQYFGFFSCFTLCQWSPSLNCVTHHTSCRCRLNEKHF